MTRSTVSPAAVTRLARTVLRDSGAHFSIHSRKVSPTEVRVTVGDLRAMSTIPAEGARRQALVVAAAREAGYAAEALSTALVVVSVPSDDAETEARATAVLDRNEAATSDNPGLTDEGDLLDLATDPAVTPEQVADAARRASALGRVYPSRDGDGFVALPSSSCPDCPSIGSTLCDADGVSIVFADEVDAHYALARHADLGCSFVEEDHDEVDSSATPAGFAPDGLGSYEPTEADHAEWLATMDREAAPRAIVEDGRTWVDTTIRCAGCDQLITVVREGEGAWFSECGGEGEGGCEAWIDGYPAAEESHQQAIAVVGRVHGGTAAEAVSPDRPRLVAELSALALRSSGKVTRLVAQVDRPSGEGAHATFLLRASHVTALAVEAATAVAAARSSDLQATVESVTASYLARYSSGDESRVARAVRFAVGRVELATTQTLRGEPTPSDPERLPETV